MLDHHRGITFLLSLGGVPIACTPTDDPITTVDEPQPSTGAATTAGSSSTGFDPTSTTAFDPTATVETDTEAPPPPEHPACVAYYENLLQCFPDRGPSYAAYWAAVCDHYIATGLELDGMACADAMIATFVCLSGLDCELIRGHEPQCVAEFDATIAACPQSWPEPP